MGTSTPNFFNSAWDLEESEYSFTDNYNSSKNDALYDGYPQNFPAGHAENNQLNAPLDYFSGRPDQSAYQSSFLPDQTNDDIGLILTPGLSFLNMDVDPIPENQFATTQASYPATTQAMSAPGMRPYAASLVFGPDGLAALQSTWPTDAKPQLPENNTERKTAVLHGQITPGDSPQDDAKTEQKESRSTRGKRSSTSTIAPKSSDQSAGMEEEIAPKPAKKPRKSKKKPITKEQEEAKRKRFLERNRVAADKCRQNRKKWIEDLQEKCHQFSAENAAKQAAVEEMEQELITLKNMLLMHSGSCKDDNIRAWMEKESKKLMEPKSVRAPVLTLEEASSPDSDQSVSSAAASPEMEETADQTLIV